MSSVCFLKNNYTNLIERFCILDNTVMCRPTCAARLIYLIVTPVLGKGLLLQVVNRFSNEKRFHRAAVRRFDQLVRCGQRARKCQEKTIARNLFSTTGRVRRSPVSSRLASSLR
jgi:hypothetical protein